MTADHDNSNMAAGEKGARIPIELLLSTCHPFRGISLPPSPYLWKLRVWVAVVDRWFPVPLQVVLRVGLVVGLEARLIAPRVPDHTRVRLEAWSLGRYVQRTLGGAAEEQKSI